MNIKDNPLKRNRKFLTVFFLTKDKSTGAVEGSVLLGAKSTKNAGVPIPPHPRNGLAGAQEMNDTVL